MKKILIGILVAVLVLGGAALLFKDAIVKVSVENGVRMVTGLKLAIGSIKVGVLNPVVHIKDLRLFNPAGFPDKLMVDMPEIYVNYDLKSIIGGKIHLSELRLNLKEFIVVKDSKGDLNLNALKVVQAQKESTKPSSKLEKGKMPSIKIDTLKLSIGKVVYKDYSRSGKPSPMEFNVNINEVYKDVTDPYKLASLIVVKALMNTRIASITNFDLKGLQGTVADTLAGAQKLATEAVAKVTKVAAEASKTTTEAAKTVAGAAQDTASKAKELLKSPFGSKE